MSELIYLDNAATAFPKPPVVIDAMAEFYRDYGVNPGRAGYDLAVEAGLMLDGARSLLDRFFNNPARDRDRVCFALNASAGLNMIIQGVCNPGDHVVATMLEHNSVLRPLYEMEQAGIITHDLVPFDGDGYVDPDDIARAIKPNTRLVVVNHGSNVIGTVQDAAAIGRICREKGVLFALDTAQTAGMIPIDMAAWNVDLLAFTGHKSLMGPTGTGGMVVGPDVPIRPTRWGGTGVKSAVRTHLHYFPYIGEVGTANTIGIAGLKRGVEWILERGLDTIRRHEMALAERLIAGLRDIPKVTLYCAGAGERHLPVVSANVEGWESTQTGELLDVEYDIATRIGLHCAPMAHVGIGTTPKGTVRFSVGPFNTEAHIEAAIVAMRDIASLR
ncbi:MAG TPA: aminotransferase class V-fold PLP-dependent enzyme [Candidatus Krumholzibacteria bacterium]|nr:aminotransferase class V-fold PLP-dependent enzyme [Candidatus Krumholzibacteria bacterium]HPD71330.1 aminotransferase class V-fold PLP-dependent enzyme [Candidatus Krumholzibacteria bacterium]HRY38970.1 aminotransferase class V-fold PLP-dependent enzyme [Candidatus Krumholzibacteria bacterium]